MGDFINKDNNICLQLLENKFRVKTISIREKVKKFKYGKNDFNPHDPSNYDVLYKKKRD